jgi:uncharacterized membrane protein YedE/YeeE
VFRKDEDPFGAVICIILILGGSLLILSSLGSDDSSTDMTQWIVRSWAMQRDIYRLLLGGILIGLGLVARHKI